MHRTGLEPVTTRFEAGYSIQLSYRCAKNARILKTLEKGKLPLSNSTQKSENSFLCYWLLQKKRNPHRIQFFLCNLFRCTRNNDDLLVHCMDLLCRLKSIPIGHHNVCKNNLEFLARYLADSFLTRGDPLPLNPSFFNKFNNNFPHTSLSSTTSTV